jgi:hypothetical protein
MAAEFAIEGGQIAETSTMCNGADWTMGTLVMITSLPERITASTPAAFD